VGLAVGVGGAGGEHGHQALDLAAAALGAPGLGYAAERGQQIEAVVAGFALELVDRHFVVDERLERRE
jgi:hypothetical protein